MYVPQIKLVLINNVINYYLSMHKHKMVNKQYNYIHMVYN